MEENYDDERKKYFPYYEKIIIYLKAHTSIKNIISASHSGFASTYAALTTQPSTL